MSKQEQAVSFFTGFMIGGLIGAATALLLAPQSGEETRTQIREKSIEIKDKASATYADAQKKVEATVADLSKKIETIKVDGQKKYEELLEQVKKMAQKGKEETEEVEEAAVEEAEAGA